MKEKFCKKYGMGATFVILSLAIIIFGVIPNTYKLITQNVSDDYVSTEAIIDNIKTTGSGKSKSHKVYICYEANGADIRTRLYTYHSGMHEGDEIEVLYNKTNPKKVVLKYDSIAMLILSVFLSLVFGISGLIFCKKYYSNRKSNNRNYKSKMLL